MDVRIRTLQTIHSNPSLHCEMYTGFDRDWPVQVFVSARGLQPLLELFVAARDIQPLLDCPSNGALGCRLWPRRLQHQPAHGLGGRLRRSFAAHVAPSRGRWRSSWPVAMAMAQQLAYVGRAPRPGRHRRSGRYRQGPRPHPHECLASPAWLVNRTMSLRRHLCSHSPSPPRRHLCSLATAPRARTATASLTAPLLACDGTFARPRRHLCSLAT